MVDDDFDIDSLMSEVSEPTKSKKKRRLVGEGEEGENFTFDFSVEESANTVSNTDKTPVYNEADVEMGTETSADKNNQEIKEVPKETPKETPKEKEDSKKSKEKNKKSEKTQKSKKGKRAYELDDLDFEDSSEDSKKKNTKDSNKSEKNRPKRRIISGNDFDILDEELEKIHEIQNQIKANKSAGAQLTKEQETEKARNRFNLVVRFIVLATLLGIIAFALLVIRYNGIITSQKRIQISQSDSVSNSSNYIYLDVPLQFEENVVKITKIRLDSQELAIYLETAIDFSKYEFHILDENLNTYYDKTDYSIPSQGGQDTELSFEPLEVGTKKFSLKVENLETGYNTETIFELKEPLIYPSVKFFYNTAPEDDKLYVQSSVFSSAYTKTSVIAKGIEEDVKFVNKQNVESGNLYLKHKGVTVPLELGESDYAYFDEYETGIAIIKHSPISALNGSVEYGAQNIYKQKVVEEYIDIRSLALGEDIVDNIYSNTVVIEGIKNYNGTIVMPMHGRKDNAIPDSPDVHYEVDDSGKYSVMITEDPNVENFDKISVEVDATLYCTDDNGEEFTVEADSRVGEEGSDIIFSDKRLEGKGLNDIQILLHSFVTIEAGINKTIDLEYTQNTQKTNDIEFENVVKQSFLSRLKYKSRELTLGYVEGFDENIITNFDFDEIYEPIATSTSAYYTTYIEGFASENNIYYAIVFEEWTARDKNNQIVKMSNKHKIAAEKQGRNYIVIYDYIMEE